MKLWLVRHAQPLIEPGICYGATDVPADAPATLAAAQAMAQALPQDVVMLSSPLQRCEHLSQSI
jgi:alpha-ribazole phosphatase